LKRENRDAQPRNYRTPFEGACDERKGRKSSAFEKRATLENRRASRKKKFGKIKKDQGKKIRAKEVSQAKNGRGGGKKRELKLPPHSKGETQ